jgi:gamma-glutamylcyclotransferase (GGCT)/AIG2-like uncharacterized protein YtfP
MLFSGGDFVEMVFVYGTLMSGFGNHRRLESRTILVGNGVTEGRLYHLGFYPGLIEGDGPVEGEVYRIIDGKVIESLDALEGYYGAGAGNLYRRVSCEVRLDNGDVCRCWTYVYEDAEEAIQNGILVEDGSWRRFMRRKETL